MLIDMRRPRLVAAALVSFGLATIFGCNAKQPNGSECLKDSDCEFGRCLQYVCFDPDESKLAQPDTGTPAADAADAADETTPPEDTAPTDTGSPDDTSPADTGTPDTGATDTGATDTDTPEDAAGDA